MPALRVTPSGPPSCLKLAFVDTYYSPPSSQTTGTSQARSRSYKLLACGILIVDAAELPPLLPDLCFDRNCSYLYGPWFGPYYLHSRVCTTGNYVHSVSCYPPMALYQIILTVDLHTAWITWAGNPTKKLTLTRSYLSPMETPAAQNLFHPVRSLLSSLSISHFPVLVWRAISFTS